MFIHYRLDGGPGGPVGTGLGSADAANRAWVDDCTLENADVVRALLERYPGQVLATFSGHDHVPKPPWTQEALGKPCYFTHRGLVEGLMGVPQGVVDLAELQEERGGWAAGQHRRVHHEHSSEVHVLLRADLLPLGVA